MRGTVVWSVSTHRRIAVLLLSSWFAARAPASADADDPTSCLPRASVDATCDGVDDDCSGQADEDFPGGSAACGVGACVRRGVLTCVDGAVHNACTPLNPLGSDASCNGVDDDCDGHVDEEFVTTVCVPTLARCLQGTSRCLLGVRSCEPAASCRNDQDRDGVDDPLDLDDDNDGVPDVVEGGEDPDADGLSNAFDLDSDGDGIADLFEAGLSRFDADGDAVVNGALGDNGLLDALELARDSGAYAGRAVDTDGDGVRDGLDLDSDGDSVADLDEVDGLGGFDRDHDGRLDNRTDDDVDGLTVDSDRDNQYGYPRIDPRATDRDGDGIPRAYDVADDGPGAGDSDADGVRDDRECPGGWPCLDADADGTPDFMDRDRSERGVDAGGALDTDHDAVADDRDAGVPSVGEASGAPIDSDDDGFANSSECPTTPCRDSDGDGSIDQLDADDDGDGVPTRDERARRDSDDDGTPDYLDADDDGDGVLTRDEHGDRDRDGIPDRLQPPPTVSLSGGALCTAGNGRGSTPGPVLLLLGVLAALTLRTVYRRRTSDPSRCPARSPRV